MSYEPIKRVEYETYLSPYSIFKVFPKILRKLPVVSFDTETRTIFTKEERAEASAYLLKATPEDKYYRKANLAVNSSGLSYPRITRVTHFIFGESKDKSHILICDNLDTEIKIWEMVAEYSGLMLIHNALFDLKIMYQRIQKFPKHYKDTSLLAKCYLNHVDIWKAKTGLKELMGTYYDPKWALLDDYEPPSVKDPKFLNYAAIDGAATYYLWEMLIDADSN